MIKNVILVPTNFSSKANIAYRQSINFAERTNGEVFLLHVIPQSKKTENLSSDIDIIHSHILKLVEDVDAKLRSKIHTRIEYGRIFSVINRVEKEISPDYVFVGSDANRKSIHSITLKLIDKVSCPIVVFSGRFNKLGCSKIVLPVDLTKETKQKVDLAVRLSKIYGPKIFVVSATAMSSNDNIEKLKDRLEEVKSIFDKLSIDCEIKLLKVKNEVEIMANAINDYADDMNADAIIIMTRQETKLQKFFVGSMATELIKKANVPIICVSPK